MLRFKPEVRIAYFSAQLGEMLCAATLWSLRGGVDVEVNSINDSHTARKERSLHDYDLAVDLDTVGDRSVHLELLYAWLRATLPASYDVVWESDHVHVESDARRGLVGPPHPFTKAAPPT